MPGKRTVLTHRGGRVEWIPASFEGTQSFVQEVCTSPPTLRVLSGGLSLPAPSSRTRRHRHRARTSHAGARVHPPQATAERWAGALSEVSQHIADLLGPLAVRWRDPFREGGRKVKGWTRERQTRGRAGPGRQENSSGGKRRDALITLTGQRWSACGAGGDRVGCEEKVDGQVSPGSGPGSWR